jgi:hypothetical protein
LKEIWPEDIHVAHAAYCAVLKTLIFQAKASELSQLESNVDEFWRNPPETGLGSP